MQISWVKRSKSSVRKAYDHLSCAYDLLAGSSETEFMHLGLDMLAMNPGEIVLEIGCGTGKALVELCHQAGEMGRVYGLDLSPGMLQVTHKRLEKGNLGG